MKGSEKVNIKLKKSKYLFFTALISFNIVFSTISSAQEIKNGTTSASGYVTNEQEITNGTISAFGSVTSDLVILPDWVYEARIANVEINVEMADAEVASLLAQRKDESVSVLVVDSFLSEYFTQTQFNAQVAFLQKVAAKVHSEGMKLVVYIPALEVLTPDGKTLPNSMSKDHPTWVQRGFDGKTAAVFYDEYDPGMENAWMSPNSGYRSYFINRIKQLAGTGIDGVQIGKPYFKDITDTNWGGGGSGTGDSAAFNAWTKAKSLGGAGGYVAPTAINWNDPAFRAWVYWRHENIADFIEEIRKEALSIKPDFLVLTQVFSIDYMDSTTTGLDKGWSKNNQNHFSVWEIDSVSSTQGMKWSSIEEYSNKIVMNKWVRSVDRENPSWAVSYGNEELDAGLVMGTAVATGVAPLEAKTPDITKSVGTTFRKRWFGFIKQHEQALLKTSRSGKIGIWYSSASRDYHDYVKGGTWGMYISTDSPNNDPNWWSYEDKESALAKPHLGGYRGAAYALTKLHIPFKIVADPGDPSNQLAGLDFLWLPSVRAISDESATIIKNFVKNGGTVFATGEVPGTLDEFGNLRSESLFKDMFNLTKEWGISATAKPEPRATIKYGKGVAVFRPDILGREFFPTEGGPELANENLSDFEQLVRIHSEDDLIVNGPEGVHVEIGKASQNKHYLYVLNYSGLKLPLVSNPQNITIQYRAPEGYRVSGATAYTPDSLGDRGTIGISKTAESWYRIIPKVDQFTLIELTLVKEAAAGTKPWPKPFWSTPERREAAESGLAFIVNKMRHSDKPVPYKYGVYTNLLEQLGVTDIYAYGHHVSGEHMGLILRVSAMMGDKTAYEQSYQYVNEAMADPLYHVVNWAVDGNRSKPLVSLDDDNPGWQSANAPLDDFRVIRGLLDGVRAFNMPETGTLAESLLTGMYHTSITDRDYKSSKEFPAYPEGLVGYAWNWRGTTEAAGPILTTPAVATSIGNLSTDPIPVDYNDLFVIAEAAKRDPRWKPVLLSATDMLLASEVPAANGLFYNGYQANGVWTGDFENRDTNEGRHLKAIQTLWISLHLARASKFTNDLLDPTRRNKALQASRRSLAFFKDFYQKNNKRVPEYLTVDGKDVADCTGTNLGAPAYCLKHTDQNLFNGEARIYAQIARLALLLDDPGFARTLITEKVLTDRISDPKDPRYGLIGDSTAEANDAESWNVLESVMTLCLEATYNGEVKKINVTTGDIDGGGKKDIIVNFGPGFGTWVRMNNSTWVKLHTLSPESMITGNMDGGSKDELIVDFGPGYGIWVFMNNSTWIKLHTLSPKSMRTGDMDGGGNDELIVNFGPGYGIWVFMNNSTWVKLHTLSPESMRTGDMDGGGNDELIVDFGPGYGIWVFMNNSTWSALPTP